MVGNLNSYRLKRDAFRQLWGIRMFKPKGGIKPSNPRFVEGFDTETTKDGFARVLSDSEKTIEVKSFEDIKDFLTMGDRVNTLNVFYNLKFDFEVMFKWEPEILKRFVKSKDNIVEFEGYKYKVIPGKCLSIKTPHKGKGINYFDIAQFFNTSLKDASKTYLGLESSGLKEDRGCLFDKYKIDAIKEYCKEDADHTRLLGEFFLATLRKLNLYPDKLYSCGYVSQLYTVNNANIPHFTDLPWKVQNFYWKAYRGGWFDTYKRGVFDAHGYDLKSAYPWALSEIPSPLGEWYQGFDEDAEVGVLDVSVYGEKTEGNPLAIAILGGNIYPSFNNPLRMFITLGEYNVLHKDFYIHVNDGWCMRESNGEYPYASLVEKLFRLKEDSRNDKGMYDTVKKIINSLYGKTAQVNKHGEHQSGGRLFNPYFAAECTARCRMRIYQALRKNMDNVISIMTDGFLLDKGINLKEGKELGDFEKTYDNEEMVVIQTGVYQSRKTLIGEKGPLTWSFDAHTRGFSRKQPLIGEHGEVYAREEVSLFDLLDTREAKLKVYQFRPRHFRECIIQQTLDKIGCFECVEKEIDLNHDMKRLWAEEIRGKDLLNRIYESMPVPSSMIF